MLSICCGVGWSKLISGAAERRIRSHWNSRWIGTNTRGELALGWSGSNSLKVGTISRFELGNWAKAQIARASGASHLIGFAVSPPFAVFIRIAAQKHSFFGLAILISAAYLENESRAVIVD